MKVTIREELECDRRSIWELHYAAFGGAGEAHLVDRLRDGGFVTVSCVAVSGDQVIGHVLFSRLLIHRKLPPANEKGSSSLDRIEACGDLPATGVLEAISLAPLAVHPNHQRQGIGMRLVELGLTRSREAGASIAVVLGDPAFYGRFGFSPELARCLQSPFGGGEAWMAMELVFGALAGVEGRVEYPPPFAELG